MKTNGNGLREVLFNLNGNTYMGRCMGQLEIVYLYFSKNELVLLDAYE